MRRDVYKELKRIAQAKGVTNYAAIGRMVDLDMNNPGDRQKISIILDDVNRYEREYKRPMLTAVVIRQDINMPGEGFFECARELGYSWESNNLVFWAHELAEVHNCYKKT